MKPTNKVENVETTKAAIEQERELSVSEKVAAYMANHAVEDYCDALNLNVENVENTLESIKKEDGLYWVFTCPAIGGTRPDGKPNPTQEEWEAANKGAIRCDILDNKQWYKKAISIDDAQSVRRLMSSLGNYNVALKKGVERLITTLKQEMCEAMMNDNIDRAMEIRARIQEIENGNK